MLFRKKTNHVINILIIAAMLFSVVIPCAVPSNAAAVKLQATGYVSPEKGAVVRKSPEYNGKKIAVVKKNTKVTITREIFKDNKSTKSIYRWYAVTSGKTKGYIRSDQIKNVRYTPVPGKTTDFLFYRYGPERNMQKKGLFVKGKSVQIVLEAYIKGSKEKWYKVKVGNEFFYSHSSWIKFDTSGSTGKTGGTGSSDGKTSSKTDTGSEGTKTVTNKKSNVTYPGTIYVGEPFSLRGTITSNKTITRVVTRIVRSDGVTVIKVEKKVGKKVFDIATVDARVKFGTLKAGKYRYKVILVIGDKHYTVINRSFNVVKGNKAARIANKAFELAWPLGTSGSTYEYGSGRPTAAYKKALNNCYPEHYNWGTAPSVGASCDVFVGTVIRASGVDTRVPRGLDEQFEYYPRSSKWKRINYSGNRSVLRNGDIILDDYSGPGAHTFVYLRRGGNEYIAEAGYQTMYGRIATGDALEYQLKYKSNRHFEVYRIKE